MYVCPGKKIIIYILKNMADDKKIIFSMVGVSKTFPPQKQVLKNIYLSFFYGAKIGIIGLNGSGKSTLLKIIAGIEKEYQGEVVFSPGYSVGYLEQDPKLEAGKTVKEIVQEGVQDIVDTLKEYEEVNEKFGDPEVLDDPDKMDALIARQAELQDKIDATDAWNLDSRLERAMDALRCPPEDQVVDTLSGGERRRVALCRLLLQQPDVLLLDEPTNHLDAESIDWLEQHLQQYAGTVICITHDRYFLDHVAGWILELDRGEGIPWKGNYSSWLDQKTKKMAMEEKQVSKRRKTLERELEWINMAPKARQAKGKARLNSYEALLNEDQKEREAKLEIFIPNGPRLGNKVIEAQHVAKAFGEKLLFDDLNFMLPPNGIVGVIGPNGAGKTTLFKMIMGMESIDKGTFEVGETVKVGYADQTHKDIDPKKTVFQVVSGGQEFIRVGGKEINSRAYLSRFNFAGADQEKLCGVLSGGERNRLHLAITLKAEANVLLLDEPTNDIDVNTLRALEEGLENFAGCAVVVSHDRWFLDRICTHILSFEGDSNVVFYEGTYSEYEEYKRKQGGDTEPKRVRYRKLIVD
ncbi:ChvD family ATP-binding cassette protein [Parabacteroides sp. HGS0025]|uniref:Energy-dependent translational throttle protein EttA n=2 Tax=Tannerellaceae TaxID=2005525 RepID=A0A0F5IVF1_9BACT|nr:ChvD family ATP-binding cassette protein [Parabacteroides gordonii MS-1 = DSM 23371]KKB51106.1 ChvD family ATP-binding cassette protein [Parabacteroides sp. HGS0025]